MTEIEACQCIGLKSWMLSPNLKTERGEDIWVHAECGRVSYPFIKECETCEKQFLAPAGHTECRVCSGDIPEEEVNRILAKYGIKR